MTEPRARLAFAAAIVLLVVVAGVLTLHDLELPGLYYDEAIQAVPAARFVSAADEPVEFPGARSVRLAGRWFPLMTQSYMGALKSQLLIPPFAAFGATPTVLRATTMAWSLLALVLVMLWARRALGLGGALIAGALLALDPAFLFVSRHDWGSFALGLLCRCAALWLLTRGWSRSSAGAMLAGGLALGLGMYNKADFVVFLAATVPALLIAFPALGRESLGPRRRQLTAALVGLTIGAAPLLAGLEGLLLSAGARAGAGLGDAAEWTEKLETLRTAFDGSYFERLMLCGGAFPRLSGIEDAAAGWFLPVFVAALLVLAAAWRLRSRRSAVEVFLLLTAVLTSVWVLLLPGAVRIHHALNVLPFPQLVVAAAAVRLWRTPPRVRRIGRALTVALLLLALGGHFHVVRRTWSTIHATGGRGFWTDATARFAEEAGDEPGIRVVCLDWGFSKPIALLAPALAVDDPSWRMRDATNWTLRGDSSRIYLVWAPEFGLFPYGRALLERLEQMPAGVARTRRYDDRLGRPAFYAVRFERAHRIAWDGTMTVTPD